MTRLGGGVRTCGVRVRDLARRDPGPGPRERLMLRGTPAGELGTPERSPHAAVYLASDEGFVHGT